MLFPQLAALVLSLSLLPLSHTAETVLGVYMFHRHGDRTPKSTPPANLTALGYSQVYTSGQYYRKRYIAANAALKINGINTDIVKQSQIAVSAPSDVVLQNSAQAFLQGLYPPVGSALGTQTLRNGTNVTAPLNGYQLIPVALVTSGSGSEDNGWLQDASNCAIAETSSNNYFSSAEYQATLAATNDFYKSIAPVVNRTFTDSRISYKNAYIIYDLLHVAEIHNATIQSADLLTPETLFQLQTRADQHEWALAYNASDNMRAIGGMTLAAEVVDFLNETITSQGKNKINVQFGAYASFLSFFGLAGLPAVNPDFYGVTDYASAMTFELFTNGPAAPFPAASDLQVRFLFHNGTTNATNEPVAYPLFGQSNLAIPWNDFVTGMSKFSVGTTEQWCTACGNTTGICAPFPQTPSSGSDGSARSKQGSGMTNAVAGVIGAFVTLAVILGIQALILLLGGLKVVNKRMLAHPVMQRESVELGKM
ncbi:hypothetical protein B0A49_09780 [Cryomyces minteri]|uniref:Acid phosphatase n=1 Tax=Cryomyces minteri TaxID=331657 RepID=A0A4U0WVN6_9PEZI|nr:hypothetical protein B0A49_09780 [Cryomyces minteri]